MNNKQDDHIFITLPKIYSRGHEGVTFRNINSTYLYTFLYILGSKFKIANATEAVSTFRHLENRHLTAQQTAQQ